MARQPINMKLSRISEPERFVLVEPSVRKFVRPNTMLPDARLSNIVASIDSVAKNDIRGAYVECGVWKGGSVLLAGLYLDKIGERNRDLHLLDSFSDICEPNHEIDGERAVQEVGGKEFAQGRLKETKMYQGLGIGYSTADQVKELLNCICYSAGSVFVHPGWFQDTLPTVKKRVGEIAILRLDADWYESTKVCLEALYDNVVPGGIIIIDDFFSYDGCRKAVEEFLKVNKINIIMERIDHDAVYWVK